MSFRLRDKKAIKNERVSYFYLENACASQEIINSDCKNYEVTQKGKALGGKVIIICFYIRLDKSLEIELCASLCSNIRHMSFRG